MNDCYGYESTCTESIGGMMPHIEDCGMLNAWFGEKRNTHDCTDSVCTQMQRAKSSSSGKGQGEG